MKGKKNRWVSSWQEALFKLSEGNFQQITRVNDVKEAIYVSHPLWCNDFDWRENIYFLQQQLVNIVYIRVYIWTIIEILFERFTAEYENSVSI